MLTEDFIFKPVAIYVLGDKLKRTIYSGAISLLLTTMVFASLANIAFADQVDWDDQWSVDGSARSMVSGKYTAPMQPYYRQDHYGYVNETGPFGTPKTCFRQYNRTHNLLWQNCTDLPNDGDYAEATTFNDDVYYVYTCTYSAKNPRAWICTISVEVGPPGVL